MWRQKQREHMLFQSIESEADGLWLRAVRGTRSGVEKKSELGFAVSQAAPVRFMIDFYTYRGVFGACRLARFGLVYY